MKRPLAISMVGPMLHLTSFVKIRFSVTFELKFLLCSACILEKPHKKHVLHKNPFSCRFFLLEEGQSVETSQKCILSPVPTKIGICQYSWGI